MTHMSHENHLGIDIGGVIIAQTAPDADTSFFGDNYLRTPEVEGAIDTIAQLNASDGFDGNISLVSKAGEDTIRKTRGWLQYREFYERTGINPSRVYFTAERTGKVAVARELGITHFVDNRAEVLKYLAKTVPNLYLFQPEESEVEKYAKVLSSITARVENMQELDQELRTSFQQTGSGLWQPANVSQLFGDKT